MARSRVPAAAALLDQYSSQTEADWEAHFVRGVAHANTRQGHESDLAALRAYNDAVALAPRGIGVNTMSRLHTYRGAILKRLGRLREAEADLIIGLELAEDDEQKLDAWYNLAGVFALQSNRSRMLDCVRQLQGSGSYKAAIRAHLGDYFSGYAQDPELLKVIGSA